MKSIERRDTQENYTGYLRRLAKAEGMDENDEDALRRMDRKRKKRMSNQEWANPHDPDAEITRMKDGSTHLAYKVEQAVDLQTGAIVAVTTHGGATGDTESLLETLPAAGEAVASEIATRTQGKYGVNQNGIQEVVTDKGYHSGTGLREIAEWKVRSYISEPERGRRKWKGKLDEQAAVYANRRRITGSRGLALLRQRGERSERSFAHQFETGAGRRLHVRGRNNVHKKLLVQAAACNLALLLRSMLGAGTPKGLWDRAAGLFSRFWGRYRRLRGIVELMGAVRTMKVHTLADCMPAGVVSGKSGFKHGLLGVDHANRRSRYRSCQEESAIRIQSAREKCRTSWASLNAVVS
jgi:transposase